VTTIITRKGIIAWSSLLGSPRIPAPNVAGAVSDENGRRIVTWDDVMRMRREHQRHRLQLKRYVEPWRACRLSVAYFGTGLMGGWHAFLDDLQEHAWIDKYCKWLTPVLMKMFPLALKFRGHDWSGRPAWEAWKEAFAKKFKRRRQEGKPVGVVYLWRRGRELRRLEEGIA